MTELAAIFTGLYAAVDEDPSGFYNRDYDQMVSWGEILSTIIVSGYLNSAGLTNEWVDITAIPENRRYIQGRPCGLESFHSPDPEPFYLSFDIPLCHPGIPRIYRE